MTTLMRSSSLLLRQCNRLRKTIVFFKLPDRIISFVHLPVCIIMPFSTPVGCQRYPVFNRDKRQVQSINAGHRRNARFKANPFLLSFSSYLFKRNCCHRHAGHTFNLGRRFIRYADEFCYFVFLDGSLAQLVTLWVRERIMLSRAQMQANRLIIANSGSCSFLTQSSVFHHCLNLHSGH